MKRLFTVFTLLLFVQVIVAQEASPDATKENDFNRWSVEAQFGLNQPNKLMAPGYMSGMDFWQGDVGVRYMFNERFGLKADFGYNHFEETGSSEEFTNKMLRTTVQGVVNVGSLLGFRDWTQRLNVLFHTGIGYGALGTNLKGGSADGLGLFVAGFTPQLRLSNHLALTADASLLGTFKQDITFDGTKKEKVKGFDAYMLQGSVGLTYYIGGSKKHADWHKKKTVDTEARNELDRIAENHKNLENDVNENKEKFVDFMRDDTNSGIPDQLEEQLDERYENTDKTLSIEDVINSYTSVHFKFNSATPEESSTEAIFLIVNYLKENPSADIELFGYVDEIGGDSDFNQGLSKERAENVKEILVKAGIEENRISVDGKGIDDSVDKSSTGARHLVRRVIFNVKK